MSPVGIPLAPLAPLAPPAPPAPRAPRATGDVCAADPALTQCADQYSVKPWNARRPCFWRTLEVMHGVLVSNKLDPERCPAQGGKVSDLLGPTGHIERASAWTHWAGAAIFLAYAIVRQQIADTESGAGVCASVAAWGVVATMISSSFYHSTAPDMTLSLVGRFFDYSSIYLGLVTTALADIAVATNSFRNVPVIAALDIPIAGGVIFAFFLWRRVRIPAQVTWARDLSRVPREQCPLGRGLFKMQHFDLHHSQLRYATSVLLTAGYFAFAPAAFATFSIPDIGVILGLQAVGFLVLSFGMYIDRVLMWPDTSLAAADRPDFPACIQCTGCGCVMTAHAWWHVIAIASIALTCFAREYALLALPD
jgi:predicted membrane channel-forming protein YqfA (hemolysin III family)